MEAMTLEREWLASYLDDGGWHDEAANVRNGIDLESYETDLRLIDWLRRHTHLAQPVQAVDVGALQKVADDLACVARLTDYDLTRGTCQSASERITRALSVQKAGPVGDDKVLWGVVANAGRLSKRRQVRWAHVSDATGQGSNASAALCRRFGFDPDEEIPASPTPDKEG